jgi:hypothetical protein
MYAMQNMNKHTSQKVKKKGKSGFKPKWNQNEKSEKCTNKIR